MTGRVIVRFSCQRLLLLVPVEEKVMFTLWLTVKGQGALVGATYGLLLRAETENHWRKRNKEKARETITDRALKSPASHRGGVPSALSWGQKTNGIKNKCTARDSSSQSTDCVPGHTTSLKSKLFAEMLKRNVEATPRQERRCPSLSLFTRGPQKPWFKGPTPLKHTHTHIAPPSPQPAG